MKNILNKILLGFCLILIANFSSAQTGLDGIVVEKYYVSTAADNVIDPTLPVGSVTYRVFVDLSAGSQLINVFGGPSGTYPMRIYSSQNFFNDATNGAGTANGVSNGLLTSGAAIVDSWLSFGGGGGTRKAIRKTDDTDGGLATPLTNSGGLMGSALTTHDGRINSAPNALAAATVGADIEGGDPAFDAFAATTNGNDFNTVTLPAGFSLYGSGPANATGTGTGNLVLIGQFTTAGTFGYTLNVQVLNPSSVVEEYYAGVTNPGGPNQYNHASLTLAPNDPPVVNSFTATPNGSVIVGTNINLAATATDPSPGTIASAKFLHNGTVIATISGAGPFNTSFAAVSGANTFLVRVFDNSGDSTTSSPITVTGGANQAPTVNIVATPSTAIVGDIVTIKAKATDVDGTIDSVGFYVDNIWIGRDITVTAPDSFSFTWTAVVGNHNFKVIAYDNLGLASSTLGGATTHAIAVANNIPPSVSITSPNASATYTAPQVVTIDALVTDSDGTITTVEFLVNNIVVGTDNVGPTYSFNWTSVIGTASLTVRATDNKSAQTTSAPVVLSIADPNALPYRVTTVVQNCLSSTFQLPIEAVDTVRNVIGYDVVLNYNRNKVTPTGIVTVRNVLIDSLIVDVSNSIDDPNGRINISAFFNGTAPSGASFFGKGTIFTVEFTKTPNFQFVDTAVFTVSSLQESRITGVTAKLVEAGSFITYRDSIFTSSLRFWGDNSPILYNSANPNDYLVTNIYGTNSSCGAQSLVSVQPNLSGNFVHNILNGLDIAIKRDILGTTSVQPLVNGMDALLTRKLLINDPSFVPNIYQMIAMDVNLDGVISAGDLSQINQRAVLMFPEFKQAWNYSAEGVSNGQPSKDWLFVDATRVAAIREYKISATFPLNDGLGFSKYKVPQVPFCLPVTVTDAANCPLITSETYRGIMMGDVNGNYQNIANNGLLRTSDKLIFDLSKAVVNGKYIDVPLNFVASEKVHAIDLEMELNLSNLNFISVINLTPNAQVLEFFNKEDNTLRLTSNNINGFVEALPTFALRFELLNGEISAKDLETAIAYLNGERSNAEVRTSTWGVSDDHSTFNSMVYPNPTSGELFVVASENSTITILDVNGKLVAPSVNSLANETVKLNTQNLSNGIYFVKISNDVFVSTKRVVFNKN